MLQGTTSINYNNEKKPLKRYFLKPLHNGFEISYLKRGNHF